ncbi:MAG: hypothetical protein OXI23_20675 [Gemmatimonadota bacterium]|nr:hypothetical protein [Gemmatimonadota bacterium]
MTPLEVRVWHAIRHRHGCEHAIRIDLIAEHVGSEISRVQQAIKSLRNHHTLRIAHSTISPTGYYIPTNEKEAKDSLARQHSALVALCLREIVTRRIPFTALLSELESEITQQMTGALAHLVHSDIPEPASKKQIHHLSHLILSSEADNDEADRIYAAIASPAFSKAQAKSLISDLRERIDQRERRRIDSKLRRMAYRDTHHPKQPTSTLIRRDESRTRGVWKKAQEASDAIFGGEREKDAE